MNANSTSAALAQTVQHLVLPEQLAQQAADAVRELLAEAAAANTTRSYTSALRYWAGWHAARYGASSSHRRCPKPPCCSLWSTTCSAARLTVSWRGSCRRSWTRPWWRPA